MPLGTEVGLGPGDIVLDGDPALPLFGKDPNFVGVNISPQRFDRSPRNIVTVTHIDPFDPSAA